MDINLFKLSIESDKDIRGTSSSLRGFFSTKFNEYNILHNHNTDKFIYRYPLVQYKMINGNPLIIGINEGSEILKRIYNEFHTLNLGNNSYDISKMNISIQKETFGISKKFHTYEFLVPWFALNIKNYEKYSSIENDEEKKIFLRKILIGNIISVSKSIKYNIPEQIKCEIDLKQKSGNFKNMRISVFTGRFYTNFIIPDHMGIGKSVSQGYGTVISLKP